MDGPGTFVPISARLHPKKTLKSSPESKFWSSFKTTFLTYNLPITSINFCPEPPHDFVVTSSATLFTFDGITFTPKSTIRKFSDVAYSGTFRPDGKLLAAGGESGNVQIFNPKGDPLRRLVGHVHPVHYVSYPHNDKLHILSGGDDGLVKWWDVASETEITTLSGHRDYIRCGSPSPASEHLWATGSYDDMVRLWDLRNTSPVMELGHGKPVEAAVFLPSGGFLATAGGNVVKIWDVIGGGKLVHTMESHNKTVTSLCVGKALVPGESEQSRLLSVSIDGYLKVFDYMSFKVVHTAKFPASLLSVGMSPSSSCRVAGSSNGRFFIGKRKGHKVEPKKDGPDELMLPIEGVGEENGKWAPTKPWHRGYFQRGQTEKHSEGDLVVNQPKRVRVPQHDKLLRKFHHKEAFVSALNSNNPEVVVPVMEELVARKAMVRSVMNLDLEELELLMKFLDKYVTLPRYAGLLMRFAERVLQLRGEDIEGSEELTYHVLRLKGMVSEEIQIQRSLLEIQGIISPILRMAGR
ncbi:protein SLOW WALKER 1 isoform X1 [Amborella trichopoda]|uniref:U3 small nucleolar RNA-associated protein 15 C-terminal domain-containing protein n=1 Tax=Amborella trichopoda TaxID=13333 RepID=W1PDN2_AMBTC|nr:protein SLOW WALKER 1 isoform X1 [Amborella trichopoda]ERN05721.1 hypothetical protein AMTR_s00006p00242700 [Amborella trichopoda]|eukprot:XP_006844046.1 protein SLOW WALKER 1 isoform X1 [Amborella trichopoda]